MDFFTEFIFGQDKEFMFRSNLKSEAKLSFRLNQNIFQNSSWIGFSTNSLIAVDMADKESKIFICQFYSTKTIRIGKKKSVTAVNCAKASNGASIKTDSICNDRFNILRIYRKIHYSAIQISEENLC